MNIDIEPYDEAFYDINDENEGLKDYIQVLEDYRDYVEAKIDMDELPLYFEEWLELEA